MITDEDAEEMLAVLKEIVATYPYNIDSCYEMRPANGTHPGGCKQCRAVARAIEIISEIENDPPKET